MSVLAQVLESCHAKDLATCCYPVLNAYYGINTDSYDLCDVRDSVVYSGEGVVKRGSNHDIALPSTDIYRQDGDVLA